MAASFSLLSTLYLCLEADPNCRASLGIFCLILNLNSEKMKCLQLAIHL